MTAVEVKEAPSLFGNAWKRAEKIDGWLTRQEAELLHSAAQRTPEGGFILEIGAFRGRSTELLASTGRKLVSVDPMIVGSQVDAGRLVTDEDAASLLNVVRAHDNADWARMYSLDIDPSVFPLINLLYIDGNHDRDSAYLDFMHYRSRLAPNALIAFHDVDSNADVTKCVKRLEREGQIAFESQKGSMYVARYTVSNPEGPKPTRVYLALPHSGRIEPETWEAAGNCVSGYSGFAVDVRHRAFSILPSNFNKCLVGCLNADHYDYFAILHSDMSAPSGWLGVLLHEMKRVDAKVMHAAAAIKNGDGFLNTAYAFDSDRWSPKPKLTLTELQKLPETFDIRDVQREINPKATRLLCNTGMLVIKLGEWFYDFPGFGNLDRIIRVKEKTWIERTVPEDWNFGHWCADVGVNVWGTRKVISRHKGTHFYSTDAVWGRPTDDTWKREGVTAA